MRRAAVPRSFRLKSSELSRFAHALIIGADEGGKTLWRHLLGRGDLGAHAAQLLHRQTSADQPAGHRGGVIAEAVGRLTDEGIGVEDINLRRPTLDDVFLALTGRTLAEPEQT